MSSKKQLSLNLLANLVTFIVGLVINLFLTPYIIKNVGIDAYGFIPLSGNIISYITIVSIALNSMAGRFITIAVHEGDIRKANIYFNTVLFSNVFLMFIFGIIFSFMVIYLEKFLNIPTTLMFDIKTLFSLTFFSSIITVGFSVFSVATFCLNRLDIRSLIAISENVIKVIVLISLFSIYDPNIIFIGVATFVVTLTTIIFNIFLTKKLLPQFKIATKYFELKSVKLLVGSGIWNSVGQTSSILLTGFDLLLANIFLGETDTSYIAISKTIPGLIWSMSAMLVAVFVPQLTILYAKKEFDKLLKETRLSLKIVGQLMTIPLAGFVVFGDIFYKLWLPNQNIQIIYLITLITLIPNFIEVFVGPLNNIFAVTNKIKMPTIAVFITGVVNLITVLILLKLKPTWGIYFIAGVSGILGSIRLLAFTPVYAAKCLQLRWTTFYYHIFKSILSTSINIITFIFIKSLFNVNSWTILIIVAVFGSIISFIMNLFIMNNSIERKYFFQLILSRIAKK